MRDRIDVTSLVAGVVFFVLGLLFLLGEVDAIEFEVRWVWPVLLIGLGVAWLASTGRSELDDERGDHDDEDDFRSLTR